MIGHEVLGMTSHDRGQNVAQQCATPPFFCPPFGRAVSLLRAINRTDLIERCLLTIYMRHACICMYSIVYKVCEKSIGYMCSLDSLE